ncbi:MAG TPA: hypothetical protein VEC37_17955, partial [Bacillota bacterium]|nr:hypothetical protein [Bacillota bacterium]
MFKRYIGYGVLVAAILGGLCSLVGAAPSFKYPINTKVTLRYLMEPVSNLDAVYANFGGTPLARELHKRTGVKCKYIHPPVGR